MAWVNQWLTDQMRCDAEPYRVMPRMVFGGCVLEDDADALMLDLQCADRSRPPRKPLTEQQKIRRSMSYRAAYQKRHRKLSEIEAEAAAIQAAQRRAEQEQHAELERLAAAARASRAEEQRNAAFRTEQDFLHRSLQGERKRKADAIEQAAKEAEQRAYREAQARAKAERDRELAALAARRLEEALKEENLWRMAHHRAPPPRAPEFIGLRRLVWRPPPPPTDLVAAPRNKADRLEYMLTFDGPQGSILDISDVLPGWEEPGRVIVAHQKRMAFKFDDGSSCELPPGRYVVTDRALRVTNLPYHVVVMDMFFLPRSPAPPSATHSGN